MQLREGEPDPEAEAVRERPALQVSVAEADVLTVGTGVAENDVDTEAEPDPDRRRLPVAVTEALRLPERVATRDWDSDPERLPLSVQEAVPDGVGVTGGLRVAEGLRLHDEGLSVGLWESERHWDSDGVAVALRAAESVAERLRLAEAEGLSACDAEPERVPEAELVAVGRKLLVGVRDAERLRVAEAEGLRVRSRDAVSEAVVLGLPLAVAAGVTLPGDRVRLQDGVEAVAVMLHDAEAEREKVRVAAGVVVAVLEREKERVEGVVEAERLALGEGLREGLGEGEEGDRDAEKERVPEGEAVGVEDGEGDREALREGTVRLREAETEAVPVGVATVLAVPLQLVVGEWVWLRVGLAVRLGLDVCVTEAERDRVGLPEGNEAVAEGDSEGVGVSEGEGMGLRVRVQDRELREAEMLRDCVPDREAECVAVGARLGLGLGLAERLRVRERESDVGVADTVPVLRVGEAEAAEAVDSVGVAVCVWVPDALCEEGVVLRLSDRVKVIVGTAVAELLGVGLGDTEREQLESDRDAEVLGVGVGVQEMGAVGLVVRERLVEGVPDSDGGVGLGERATVIVGVELGDREREKLRLVLGLRG